MAVCYPCLMASTYTVFFLLSISFTCGGAQPQHMQCSHPINLSSSLHPTSFPSSWPSPSGQFAFGFYREGNGFMVGIWLVGIDNNITVVWTANRDDPPVTSNATTLDLTKSGKLLLKTDEQGEEKPISIRDRKSVV